MLKSLPPEGTTVNEQVHGNHIKEVIKNLYCKSFMVLMQLNVQQLDSYSKSVNDKA